MDTIEFGKKIITYNFTKQNVVCAVPVINGYALTDIMEKYERQAAEKNGFEYTGFGYEYQLADILYNYLLSKSSCVSENEVALMICSDCHDEGCWPLLVTIDETENEIIWRNFHNPHRSNPSKEDRFGDYSIFPVFHFSKVSYKLEIEKLKEMARTLI